MHALQKSSSINALREIFSGAMNLLCIDDHPEILDIVCDGIFTSPLFTKKTAKKVETALRAINGPVPYHCWILDLSLEKHNDGLDLFKVKPHFPYCIALSGSQSLEDATNAMRAGCYGAFNKNHIVSQNAQKFIFEVCSLSTLSFLLKTKKPSRYGMFNLLMQYFIRSPQQWSELHCLNEYSLRETCMENSGLTAKQFLYGYHALRIILLLDCHIPSFDGNNFIFEEIFSNHDFIQYCADYVLSHIDSVFGPIYLK
jgi:hypothetical protein